MLPWFLVVSGTFAADGIVIGHPACLSGKYAKAGEQAIGGIKACIDWVNSNYGGVSLGDKKVPLEYKYYDCESSKEQVTSLIGRLITVDKVNVVFAPYSSGFDARAVRQSPKATRCSTWDHGGASKRNLPAGI